MDGGAAREGTAEEGLWRRSSKVRKGSRGGWSKGN